MLKLKSKDDSSLIRENETASKPIRNNLTLEKTKKRVSRSAA